MQNFSQDDPAVRELGLTVRKCDILKESYPVKQHTVDECAKLLEPDWPETQTDLI